ncbi:Gfo/Idh/MocA family oxidoreductase, partial [Salmonella enterica]|uniref:Gfo/Idh/MocA family oxidoreductase n=1 Tax=Salmonella enterica TaxID=28901 RepID=UPI003297F98C
LTSKKAIERWKLGKIVEVVSICDFYRAVEENYPGLPQDGAFYGLCVHRMDLFIWLFGRPDHVAFVFRCRRNNGNA